MGESCGKKCEHVVGAAKRERERERPHLNFFEESTAKTFRNALVPKRDTRAEKRGVVERCAECSNCLHHPKRSLQAFLPQISTTTTISGKHFSSSSSSRKTFNHTPHKGRMRDGWRRRRNTRQFPRERKQGAENGLFRTAVAAAVARLIYVSLSLSLHKGGFS